MRDIDTVLAPGGFNMDAHSKLHETVFEGDSFTVQSQAADADINTIVKRFGITGELPQGLRPPTFEDFSEVVDFHTAQQAIVEAREAFMQMPADVRARFHNDPGEFVQFCSDEANLPEMRKLGLAVPEVEADDEPEAPEVPAQE